MKITLFVAFAVLIAVASGLWFVSFNACSLFMLVDDMFKRDWNTIRGDSEIVVTTSNSLTIQPKKMYRKWHASFVCEYLCKRIKWLNFNFLILHDFTFVSNTGMVIKRKGKASKRTSKFRDKTKRKPFQNWEDWIKREENTVWSVIELAPNV